MNQIYISVYLTTDVLGWVIGKRGWRIKEISFDTHTDIKLENNCYFNIRGLYEDVHKARIILQDLEKNYYLNNLL